MVIREIPNLILSWSQKQRSLDYSETSANAEEVSEVWLESIGFMPRLLSSVPDEQRF